ncbi:MAG: hypothetical protein NTZ78_04890 [Candidatus Aureabacteria bacterium]|nr:hypothetical protein [Candidatus Auribacterota bacterium]
MKKFSVLVLVILIICVVFLIIKSRAPEIPFAALFPEGAVAYLGVNDGAKLADDIEKSGFWRGLSGTGCVKEAAKSAREGLRSEGIPLDSLKALDILLGEKSAIALYGRESRFGLSVLAAVKTEGDQERLLARIRNEFRGVPAGSYGGMEIYSFQIFALPPIEGVYARAGENCLFALSLTNSMDALREMIDLKEGRARKPLSKDETFRAGMGKPLQCGSAPTGYAYLNLRALHKEAQVLALLENRIRQTNPSAAEWLSQFLKTRFPVISYGGYFCREKGFAATLRTRLEQPTVCAATPRRLNLLSCVPAGTVAFTDFQIGDAAAVWGACKTQVMATPLMRLLGDVQARYGINLEKDILPWVGEEAALLLSDIQTGGLLPIAKAGLVVSVKDRVAAQKTLLKIMERICQPSADAAQETWTFLKPHVSTHEHAGEEVRTLSYPLPGFSPSFACMGNYLVIGLDRASVETIIDAGKGNGRSVLAEEKFASLMRRAPKELTQVSYFDCDRLREIGEGVANWYLAIKGFATPPEEKERADRIARMKSDIPRIFAALKVFQAALVASTQNGDAIDHSVAIRLRD